MLKFEDIKIDKEFQELLPVLTIDEYGKLEQDILKYGILDPIKVWQDPETDCNDWIVIDGHNRYSILKKHIKENNRLYDPWTSFKIMYETELKNREEVKQWMLEQQLGRRNLSEVARYEIVQKFKGTIENRAKNNLSAGGKGLSNLTKVNTRKEMAQKVNVSEGTYRKLDEVMQSDNEEVKDKLRKGEISIDKAFKMLTKPVKKKQEIITPIQQIKKIDGRMEEIDKQISSLKEEYKSLSSNRAKIFEGMDIDCSVKYEWDKCEDEYSDDCSPIFWKCVFYVEANGIKNILYKYEYSISSDEYPDNFIMRKIPDKYKNDFKMVWQTAHDELVKILEQYWKKIKEDVKDDFDSVIKIDSSEKVYLKKIYRVLANTFHPDNTSTGNVEMMAFVNKLKESWGI